MGELSSTRTTSSATGGSTSTVPRPRVSTASTTSTPPRGPPLTQPPATLRKVTPPQWRKLLILDTPPLLNIQELKVLPARDDRDLLSVITGARDDSNLPILVNATILVALPA